MNSLISIIMCIYNEEIEWIQQSVKSILAQSYINFEFLIIIDNPKINNVIKDYLYSVANEDQRVHLIENDQNLGLPLSLNKGLEYAKGEYIARMDADDISEPDRIKKQLQYITQFDMDLVGTGRMLIDEEGKILDSYESPIRNDALIQHILPFGSCFVHPTVMIRAEVLKRQYGYRNFKQSQDYDLWLRLLDEKCKFANIDEPLLRYRIRENGITNKKPYVQYMTAKYQKALHQMRLKYGKDDFSEESFNHYLENNNVYSEAKNNKYSKALNMLNVGIGELKKKNIKGLGSIIMSIIMFPEMFTLLIEKTLIVYYMNKYRS